MDHASQPLKPGPRSGSGSYPAFTGFNVQPDLLASAKSMAERRGVSLASLMRTALQREVEAA